MTDRGFEELWQTIPDGWLTKPEGRLLLEVCEQLEPESVVLEVGSHIGRSTKLLAGLPNVKILHAVDPWESDFCEDTEGDVRYSRFLRRLNPEILSGVVRPHRCKIEEMEVRPEVDFLFLDGDHTADGTVNQIRYALNCKPSFVAVHDVNDRGGGRKIKELCLEFFGHWVKRVERLAYWNLSKVES